MFFSSVVIQNEHDEILLVREADPRVYGQWNLPGGHAEPGESPLDAACRETREEVGLEVHPDSLLGIYQHADGHLNFVFAARVDRSTEPVPNLNDILSCHWSSVSDALELPPDQVLRHCKLCAILQDLLAGRRFPCDIIRSIPPEHWES